MAADLAIGRQLRARRTAAGRTVASVAADAGLSVPYIANLENGRGNPTTAALCRLAGALGTAPGDHAPAGGGGGAGLVAGAWSRADAGFAGPARAARGGSGRRPGPWRRRWAGTRTSSPLQLVPALALLGQALGRDLAEPDWWRVMDALLLVAAHPG